MPTITETKCTCKACGHIWYYGKSEVWQQAGNVLHNAGTAASCCTCSPCCMFVPDKPVKDLLQCPKCNSKAVHAESVTHNV